ncbi:MAG TPA: Sua5/YciO/YrdC/YwlC family protein, partial [Saprospiraceae bacterium]|nr:Sua5/YciO/YrdC/YwlC family protein [Saprospiraceae bacterium]
MNFENDDIEHIADLVQQDAVILYPTDTIWGLGCNALSEKAIQKIISIKGRPPEKGFVVLV